MAKVEIKSKEAKARAALAGGKSKKKKWNKKKVQEKLSNQVLFEQKTYDKLVLEVPKVRFPERSWCCCGCLPCIGSARGRLRGESKAPF